MKRVGHLWKDMIAFPALLQAAETARRGKRFRPDVAAFHHQQERELTQLKKELDEKVYKPGQYHCFVIHEPKHRLISAAPYRDRVIHHALTACLEPIFEPTFTSDSYACRKSKGTHAAVRRARRLARRFQYVLKADIRQFFPSIDHGILKRLIARKIKDPNVLWLVDRIVDSSAPQEQSNMVFAGDDLFTSIERRCGLPIGNQTSQFFANVYLNPLDHFVKERLRCRGYVRYVDDFVLFSNDKAALHSMCRRISDFLVQLRLKLHPKKTNVFPVTQGIRFLGYRVFPTHCLLAKQNIRRFRRRVTRMQQHYAAGEITLPEIRQRLMSWAGHAAQADTWNLRHRLFSECVFQRPGSDRTEKATG